jgi:hypothetical protein
MGERVAFLIIEILSITWAVVAMYSMRHRVREWREWLAVIVILLILTFILVPWFLTRR